MARDWSSYQIEDRGRQVDVLHDVGHAAPGSIIALLFDDERDMEVIVVDEETVFFLAMFAKSLAMIGQEHHRRTIVKLMTLQILDQLSDDLVAVCDRSVVRRIRCEAVWYRIGCVRLLTM